MDSFTLRSHEMLHTDAMLRLTILVTALVMPIALVYAAGAWALAACAVAAAAVLLFSSRAARGIENHQGGRLTGYRSTSLGDL